MSSSFAYSFDQFNDDSPLAAGTHSFYAPHSFSTVVGVSHPEMEHDESFALREWRRQNAIRLEEKERREKELRSQIIARADEYKVEFYRKRQAGCEANKVTNREKEKVFVAMQEKFHGEADKDYWKAIAEMIPKDAPTIERRSVKKYEGKKKAASTVVVQGPKPGKPSDLSRMREIILKLKHNTPPHLNLSP